MARSVLSVAASTCGPPREPRYTTRGLGNLSTSLGRLAPANAGREAGAHVGKLVIPGLLLSPSVRNLSYDRRSTAATVRWHPAVPTATLIEPRLDDLYFARCRRRRVLELHARCIDQSTHFAPLRTHRARPAQPWRPPARLPVRPLLVAPPLLSRSSVHPARRSRPRSFRSPVCLTSAQF